MAQAIRDGRGPASFVSKIEKAEVRIAQIEAELAHETVAPALEQMESGRFEAAVEEKLKSLRGLLKSDPSRARQRLEELFTDQLGFSPMIADCVGLTYTFGVQVNDGTALQETAYLNGVPRGIRPLVAASLQYVPSFVSLLLPPTCRAPPQPPGARAGVCRDASRIGHRAASGPLWYALLHLQSRPRTGSGFRLSRNQCLALPSARCFQNHRVPQYRLPL
jgi:hypothetical protein